jgi:hypothetical protein
MARSTVRPFTHRIGSASVVATATVHGRSVHAPQITIAAASGSRTRSGTWITPE